MFKRNIIVKLPQEKVYSYLVDYFKEGNIKEVEDLKYNEFYLEFYHAWDVIKIQVLSMGEYSNILLDFNFNMYLSIMMILFIVALSICLYATYIGKSPSSAFIVAFSIIYPISQIYIHIKFEPEFFKNKISDYFKGIEAAFFPEKE